MTTGFTISAILCIIFGVGAVVSARNAWHMFAGNNPYGDAVMGVMLAMLALFLVACLLGTIGAYRYLSGPTFELMRSEWRCSKARVVKDDDGDYTVCEQYSRI